MLIEAVAFGCLWVVGIVGLTVNHLLRERKIRKIGWVYPLRATLDSAFWPIYFFLYGASGMMREVTGRPW